MRIVEERSIDGPNLILPARTIVLGLERAAGYPERTADLLAGAVGSVNKALAPLDNPFLQVSVGFRPEGLGPAEAAGEFVAETAVALQRQYLSGVSRVRVLGAGSGSRIDVAYEYWAEGLALHAGRTAVAICALVLDGDGRDPASFAAAIEAFKESADKVAPVYDTRLLLREAVRRGIPWRRAIKRSPVIDFGQGARRRRFRNTMAEGTSDTAYRLSSYKPLAAQLFDQHGIPVPRQGVAESADRAAAVARRIGFPVVVKPVSQDRGVGVRTRIVDEAELREAYRTASAYGPVQIERHLPGFDHRFTFIRDVLVGVLKTTPPIIVGDGSSSVRALLEAEPTKTATLAKRKIIVDEEVLAHVAASGFALDDILPPGRSIMLRKWWRNRPDHRLENVTAITHPDNVEVALRAVRLIGLDVAGVDYITEDISLPWHRTGGAITEVNPMPAMAGMQRCGMPAFETLFDAFFPDGQDARIPTALVLGSGGGDLAARLLAAMLARSGHAVALSLGSRLEIDGRPIRMRAGGEKARMQAVLFDPQSTAAILECTPEAVGRDGLAIDLCDVAIVAPDTSKGPSEADSTFGDGGQSDAAALLAALARKTVVAAATDPAASRLAVGAGPTPIVWVRAANEDAAVFAPRLQDLVVSGETDGDRLVIAIAPASATEAGLQFAVAMPEGLPADPPTLSAILFAVAGGHALDLAPVTMAEAIAGVISSEEAPQPGDRPA